MLFPPSMLHVQSIILYTFPFPWGNKVIRMEPEFPFTSFRSKYFPGHFVLVHFKPQTQLLAVLLFCPLATPSLSDVTESADVYTPHCRMLTRCSCCSTSAGVNIHLSLRQSASVFTDTAQYLAVCFARVLTTLYISLCTCQYIAKCFASCLIFFKFQFQRQYL